MTTDAKILSALRENPDGFQARTWPGNWDQPRGGLGAHRGIAPAGLRNRGRSAFRLPARQRAGRVARRRFARAPRTKRSHRPRHPRVRADDLDE